MQRKKKKTNTFLKRIQRKIENIVEHSPFLKEIGSGKELYLFGFFSLLFFILVINLFSISILKQAQAEQELNIQHTKVSLLKAKRGGIYIRDKSGNPINLTENVTLYNIFIDPKYMGEKNAVINILTPVLYEHLCKYYALEKVTPFQCIRNLEIFSKTNILPQKPEITYYGSGKVKENFHQFKDMTGYTNKVAEVISGFTTQKAEYLIKKSLNDKIQIGERKLNYIGFFTNEELIKELKNIPGDYININDNNYVYINPHTLTNNQKNIAITKLKKIFIKFGYPELEEKLTNAFTPQENRYVKLASNANSEIAQKIRELKEKYLGEIIVNASREQIPILHGLGLEEFTIRYYPLGDFLSNIVGYVDKNGNAYYGIEEYFNDTLKGVDGEIEGRATSTIGSVGANEFEIKNVRHGDNIYLTIDIGIQKKIEEIAKRGKEEYRADSVSILVYNPKNGKIKAATNYPNFNPNNYNSAYTLEPISPEKAYILDDQTQVEIPVYIKTGGKAELATLQEKKNPTIKKYVPENIYGASVFIDKNFTASYEPGSIFKLLTTAIGLDTDEIDLYDMYTDPGEIKVGEYSIFNADKKNCKGEMPFIDALIYSCNIGMVRIAQKVNRTVFYNYLAKLGLGKKTGIELANENAGNVRSPSTISKVGYFNNTFGQGILTTPIQMVSALGTILNGGYYIKPTIIEGRENTNTNIYTPNKPKVEKQIFKPETVKQMRDAMFAAMEKNPDYVKFIRIPDKHMGGKSGTSEIAYRGIYRKGAGWTDGSYIGVTDTNNPEYIILVKVHKPRSTQWGVRTAGKLFGEVARFILSYTQGLNENTNTTN